MSPQHRSRAARSVAAAALVFAALTPLAVGSASGAESVSDLKARMAAVQARLDNSTLEIERLEDEMEDADHRVQVTEQRIKKLEARDDRLEEQVVARAKNLYMSGREDIFEALFGSQSIAELSEATEMLSQLNLDDSGVFVELARSRAEMVRLQNELVGERKELREAYEQLKAEHEKQQALFDSVAADYESLQDRVAPSAPSAARVRGTGGMFCPVGGPTSFVDS